MASILTRSLKKGLDCIELVGNKLPHPATLFALLAVLVALASWIAEMVSLQAIHPADQSVITVNNLLSPDGLRWMYTHIMSNFVTFPPLGYALTGILLIVAFVLLSGFINLFMGSASAKWAIMAPVFVPMFMLLGYHPALTPVAFRIGDSTTNLITPMMSYFALIVAFSQKYDEKYGIGTIIATMMPYTIFLLIFWIIILCLWMALGFPLGPGGPLHL